MVNVNFGKINVIFEDNNMFIEKIDINVESLLFFQLYIVGFQFGKLEKD